jgi:hypothetical protein
MATYTLIEKTAFSQKEERKEGRKERKKEREARCQ